MLALSQDLHKPTGWSQRACQKISWAFLYIVARQSAIESTFNAHFFLLIKCFYSLQNLAENGYYNRIISGNIIQNIDIDSITCNFESYPFNVLTYTKANHYSGKQHHRTKSNHKVQTIKLIKLITTHYHWSIWDYWEQRFTSIQTIKLWQKQNLKNKLSKQTELQASCQRYLTKSYHYCNHIFSELRVILPLSGCILFIWKAKQSKIEYQYMKFHFFG